MLGKSVAIAAPSRTPPLSHDSGCCSIAPANRALQAVSSYEGKGWAQMHFAPINDTAADVAEWWPPKPATPRREEGRVRIRARPPLRR